MHHIYSNTEAFNIQVNNHSLFALNQASLLECFHFIQEIFHKGQVENSRKNKSQMVTVADVQM